EGIRFVPGRPGCSDSGDGIDLNWLSWLGAQLAAAFGLPAHACDVSSQLGEVKLYHPVATLAWQRPCGAAAGVAPLKRIPHLVWSLTEELRAAFLGGYLQSCGSNGTGSTAELAFPTQSRELASGLQYLLSTHGVVGVTRLGAEGNWAVAVTAPGDL